MVRVGAWERGLFIGCVLYSRGANPHIGSDFGLLQSETVELTRVALTKHDIEVSRIIAIACKYLKKTNDGIRLLVSFADPGEGHSGGIYQAGGWIYSGHGSIDKRVRRYTTKDGRVFHWRTVAKWLHSRRLKKTVSSAYENGFKPSEFIPKHRYLMPLDAEMRARVLPLAKPYPKRPKKPDGSDQEHRGRGSTDPDAPI